MENETNQVNSSQQEDYSMARDYMYEMIKHNLESRALLREMNENMQQLVDATRASQELLVQQAQIPRQRLNGDMHVAEQPSSHDEGHTDALIARTSVRLDGLEVYAVVSALTCATLYQCFESFNCDDFGRLYQEGHYIELFGDIVFLFSSATGVLAGLHSTLVFSLITIYGRTAIGMGRDEAFEIFFKKTSLVRFRGFRAFLWSLYAYLVQVGIVITSKVPQRAMAVFFVAIVFLLYQVYRDTDYIITIAGGLFAPPKPATVTTNKQKSS
jgi:uncharacterized membrane protein